MEEWAMSEAPHSKVRADRAYNTYALYAHVFCPAWFRLAQRGKLNPYTERTSDQQYLRKTRYAMGIFWRRTWLTRVLPSSHAPAVFTMGQNPSECWVLTVKSERRRQSV